jgi:hypothetical protein
LAASHCDWLLLRNGITSALLIVNSVLVIRNETGSEARFRSPVWVVPDSEQDPMTPIARFANDFDAKGGDVEINGEIEGR